MFSRFSFHLFVICMSLLFPNVSAATSSSTFSTFFFQASNTIALLQWWALQPQTVSSHSNWVAVFNKKYKSRKCVQQVFLGAFSTYFSFERFLLLSLMFEGPSDKVLLITLQNLHSSRETLHYHTYKKKQKKKSNRSLSVPLDYMSRNLQNDPNRNAELYTYSTWGWHAHWVMCTNRTWQGQTAHLSWLTVSMFWITQACEGLRSLLPHNFIVVWPGEESRKKETGRREDWDKRNGALNWNCEVYQRLLHALTVASIYKHIPGRTSTLTI